MATFMDGACLIKNIVSCANKDSCAIFDPDKVMFAFSVLVTVTFKTLSVLFCFWCFKILRNTEVGDKLYTKTDYGN